MSRVVPLPALNTVVDNTVIVLNADGSPSTPGGVSSSLYADQQVITAAAVALASQALINGVVIRTKSSNVGSVFVGGSTVTATDDGSGNGFALPPNATLSLPVGNASAVYVIGTAGDISYVTGN